MTKQYVIVSSHSKFELEIQVKIYLENGWKLSGGVSFDTNRKEFLQAVTKA